MTSIPPDNIIGSIAAASVTQKQRAAEQDTETHKQAEQAREQAALSDKKGHQVEDTVETANRRVRPHNEEEAQQRKKQKNQTKYDNPDAQDQSQPSDHIDLEA